MPKKMMFARLDVSTFLICCSGDLSDNESDEKHSVAICGGSICILTGLHLNVTSNTLGGRSNMASQYRPQTTKALQVHCVRRLLEAQMTLTLDTDI